MKRGIHVDKVYFHRPHAGSDPKYTLREFLVTKGYKSGKAATTLILHYDEPLPPAAMVTATCSNKQSKTRYSIADLNAWWSRIEAKRKAKEAEE